MGRKIYEINNKIKKNKNKNLKNESQNQLKKKTWLKTNHKKMVI